MLSFRFVLLFPFAQCLTVDSTAISHLVFVRCEFGVLVDLDVRTEQCVVLGGERRVLFDVVLHRNDVNEQGQASRTSTG